MNNEVELVGGPSDGDRFVIVVPETEVFPPPFLYMSPPGWHLHFAGPGEGEPKVLARSFAIYRHSGRATAEGRVVYEYEGGG